PQPAHEAFVAVSKPVDPLYPVVVVEAQDDRSDDVVQAGAQAAARHDAAGQRRGVEVQRLAGAGRFHGGWFGALVEPALHLFDVHVIKHALPVADEPASGHRRCEAARSEALYREIELGGLMCQRSAPGWPVRGGSPKYRRAACPRDAATRAIAKTLL